MMTHCGHCGHELDADEQGWLTCPTGCRWNGVEWVAGSGIWGRVWLDCRSLEDWTPNAPREAWRKVEIVDNYEIGGQRRLSVRILEGPDQGRVVNELSPGNLRHGPPAPRPR